MTIGVTVIVRGGMVQDVFTSQADPKNVEVTIIDYDTDGASEDELVVIENDRAFVSTWIPSDWSELAESARIQLERSQHRRIWSQPTG